MSLHSRITELAQAIAADMKSKASVSHTHPVMMPFYTGAGVRKLIALENNVSLPFYMNNGGKVSIGAVYG